MPAEQMKGLKVNQLSLKCVINVYSGEDEADYALPVFVDDNSIVVGYSNDVGENDYDPEDCLYTWLFTRYYFKEDITDEVEKFFNYLIIHKLRIEYIGQIANAGNHARRRDEELIYESYKGAAKDLFVVNIDGRTFKVIEDKQQ